ncbi:hypothetical protein EYF80_038047 [Liparis tanakae]|uniref:Uncharacterized protein n=1 Tax=Liparis tanakae TaxID=230148 RepID=A0A4Z2GDU8_9TELE|nr:hypothetical protein EYF80_038047 [Liparis tanakae]
MAGAIKLWRLRSSLKPLKSNRSVRFGELCRADTAHSDTHSHHVARLAVSRLPRGRCPERLQPDTRGTEPVAFSRILMLDPFLRVPGFDITPGKNDHTNFPSESPKNTVSPLNGNAKNFGLKTCGGLTHPNSHGALGEQAADSEEQSHSGVKIEVW